MQWNINSVHYLRLSCYPLLPGRALGTAYIAVPELSTISRSESIWLQTLVLSGTFVFTVSGHSNCHDGIPARSWYRWWTCWWIHQGVHHMCLVCPEYRSGPLLMDQFHILLLSRRRGYQVPSEGTADSGRLDRAPRVLRRADCSRAREEHPSSPYLYGNQDSFQIALLVIFCVESHVTLVKLCHLSWETRRFRGVPTNLLASFYGILVVTLIWIHCVFVVNLPEDHPGAQYTTLIPGFQAVD